MISRGEIGGLTMVESDPDRLHVCLFGGLPSSGTPAAGEASEERAR